MLRFPEFQFSEPWAPTTIGALGRFCYGKSAPKWSLSDGAPTPCVRYGELYTKFGPAITETYSKTNIAPEKLRFSKGGEILIPRVGEKAEDFGKCCAHLTLRGVAIGEMISILETRQNPLFYTYYFRRIYSQFARVVEGQNVKNLYFTELEPLPIYRPSIPEQQRIADCLASVDELIAAQARKVDALKAHKEGLMQRLLPQEGETQPRLRFTDVPNAGPWEVRPLGEVATYENGKAYEQEIAPEGKYIVVNSRFISTNGSVRKYTNAEHLTANAGDVLMVLSDLPKGRALAKCYFVEADDRYAVNQRVCRLKGKRLNSKFLFYILNRNPKLLSYDDGQNQTHLSKGNVLECPLSIPPSRDEQQRIADCLTSFDDLVAAEKLKLDRLKTHKTGLMQQLFPSAAEDDA